MGWKLSSNFHSNSSFIRNLIFYNQDIPIDSIDRIIAPKNALQNPSTSIPGTKYATNINNKAFINKIDTPNVRIFIGNVNKIKTGLITKFTNAMTIEATNAEVKPDIVIPGIIQPINIIEKDNANHFNKISIKTPFIIIINGVYLITLNKLLILYLPTKNIFKPSYILIRIILHYFGLEVDEV